MYHQLLGSMTRSGKQAAADYSRPKAVARLEELGRKGKGEIEDLEFSRPEKMDRPGDSQHVRPTARYLVKDNEETEHSAEHVQKHLHNVSPNDSCHAAFKCVEKCKADNNKNRDNFAGTQHDRDYKRNGENSDPFRESAQNQEGSGRESANTMAEPALHQLVSRIHLAAKVLRQKQGRDDHTGKQIAEDHLQEAEISAKGESWRTDDGKRARFSRYNGKGNRPPRRISAAQEIVL